MDSNIKPNGSIESSESTDKKEPKSTYSRSIYRYLKISKRTIDTIVIIIVICLVICFIAILFGVR